MESAPKKKAGTAGFQIDRKSFPMLLKAQRRLN
jgi:hypothetical protein